jgi:hypothetical protein
MSFTLCFIDAECRKKPYYAECHYAKSHYAECRCTSLLPLYALSIVIVLDSEPKRQTTTAGFWSRRYKTSLALMGLYHSLDGITTYKYKLLRFLTIIFLAKRRRH